MAGFIDYVQISSFAAENKERPEDIVRFPSGGETPDQGALRHSFEKAGADIYEKMAENIVPSINAAVNPLRDPGCGNGILPADGRESAGSSRSGCAGGCRRAIGISYSELGFNNYAGFEGYAPAGGTALTTIFLGDTCQSPHS
ncbi:MAG: hypothetical protein LBU32_23135 [Clostridiales bacterium]|nr:hypothetical protein [Clostridiales bacterium]